MKTKAFFFSLLLTVLSLPVWSQSNSYFIGNRPLSTIDNSFIEVSFCRVSFRFGENMAISYGQECLARPALISTRNFLLQCNGLTDGEGELVFFNDYVEGLNFIESQGWELMQVMENATDGSSSPRSSKYLFKRKFPANGTVGTAGGR